MEFLGGANSIWKLACRYAISDGVPRRSLYVALIVGTVAQPDQSGRCAARNGIHQLAETDFDLLRTLRGVYLRRSLVSVEESGCNARTKRLTKETLKETVMSPEFDKRVPAALLILRFFLGTFLLQWHREAHSSERYRAHRQ